MIVLMLTLLLKLNPKVSGYTPNSCECGHSLICPHHLDIQGVRLSVSTVMEPGLFQLKYQ